MTAPVASAATIALLAAAALPKVGPVTLRKLLATPKDLPAAAENIAQLFARASPEAREVASDGCEQILASCSSEGIWAVSVFDPSYPKRLRGISDYPPILYGLGNTAAIEGASVAVVGTRNASKVGVSHARKIAATLCEAGYCVVSGLALGIDTAAHEGALSVNGRTVAVLAHGLDTVAPASNRDLAKRIVQTDGALISEHPPGIRPYPPEFVRRNRIQSGMALASVMVESGEEGGSIHQARFTRQQGRPLFAVYPTDELGERYGFQSAGALRVQREFGAAFISTREDLKAVIDNLGIGPNS